MGVRKWYQNRYLHTCPKSLENFGFSGFSFAFRNRFFVGRRIVEIVDFYIIHFFRGSASANVFTSPRLVYLPGFYTSARPRRAGSLCAPESRHSAEF